MANFLSWTLGWPSHHQDLWSQSKCYFCCVTREPIICVFLCIICFRFYLIIHNLTLIRTTIYILSACAGIQNNLFFSHIPFFFLLSCELHRAWACGEQCETGPTQRASSLQLPDCSLLHMQSRILPAGHQHSDMPGRWHVGSIAAQVSLWAYCLSFATFA